MAIAEKPHPNVVPLHRPHLWGNEDLATLESRMVSVMKSRHYSGRTIKAYLHWVRRYFHFHVGKHPRLLRELDVNEFLTHLAVKGNVAASTQNQALAALLVFYDKVLGQSLDRVHGVVRARKPKHLPDSLSRREVEQLFSLMDGVRRLAAMLIYGSGLRLTECLSLRVKDIDFDRRELLVRDGKGAKDRVTTLPESLEPALKEHLKVVKRQHQADLNAGLGRVPMPDALARKYPNADREWPWQWVFPASSHFVDRETGISHRYHLHQSVIQKAIRAAVRASDLPRRASAHTLRHSFATQLLESRHDIRTIQELMGHKDVRTTMIYTHVLNRGALGVRSPLDQNW